MAAEVRGRQGLRKAADRLAGHLVDRYYLEQRPQGPPQIRGLMAAGGPGTTGPAAQATPQTRAQAKKELTQRIRSELGL